MAERMDVGQADVANPAGQAWRERLVQFGENGHLIGTLTVPVPSGAGAPGSVPTLSGADAAGTSRASGADAAGAARASGADAAGVSRASGTDAAGTLAGADAGKASGASRASGAHAGKNRPSLGVVLMNAGVIHRIGPHRINVKLARAVAEDGLPSLRVDLTGLGDSGRTRATDGMLAQACRDIRAAIDVLQAQTGVEKVVLSGICSGAEYGYQYALEDSRVAGLVMVDGYSFGNLRTRLLRWGLRLRTMTWPVFRNAVMGRIKKWRERGENDVPQTPVDYGLPVVTVEGFGHGLAERARAGCPTYLLFTGSVLQRYNHASQFADTMRAAPLADEDRVRIREAVQCDFLPDIDHTMTTLHGQRVYVARVRQWLAGLRARG